MNDESSIADRGRKRLQTLLEQRLAAHDGSPNPVGHCIPIHAAERGVPLICVLGGGAGLVTYRRLSELLPDLPMFALQLHSPGGSAVSADSIEAMARNHLRILREHLPTGPYYLCGHSMGATVAFELAQRLRQSGNTIAGLFIVDQPGPDVKLSLRDWWYWQWAAISHLSWRMKWNYIAEGTRFRLRTSRHIPMPLRRWFSGGNRSSKGDPAKSRMSVNEYRRRMTDASIQALRAYHPQPCDFPCILIRAQSGAPRLHADRFGGWGTTTGERIRVFDMPGTHMTMFQPSQLPALAGIFREVIDSKSELE